MPEFSTMLSLQAQMMLLLAIGIFLTKKQIITENNLLVTKLAALDESATAATTANVVETLKKALNVTLSVIHI